MRRYCSRPIHVGARPDPNCKFCVDRKMASRKGIAMNARRPRKAGVTITTAALVSCRIDAIAGPATVLGFVNISSFLQQPQSRPGCPVRLRSAAQLISTIVLKIGIDQLCRLGEFGLRIGAVEDVEPCRGEVAADHRVTSVLWPRTRNTALRTGSTAARLVQLLR